MLTSGPNLSSATPPLKSAQHCGENNVWGHCDVIQQGHAIGLMGRGGPTTRTVLPQWDDSTSGPFCGRLQSIC
jgi:hypothetical protein